MVASQARSTRQSLSMKARIGARDSATPRLRAGPAPGVASSASSTPGKPATTASGSAREPLSMTITSARAMSKSWAKSELEQDRAAARAG